MSATAITAEIRIMGHPACPGLFKKDAQAVPEKGSVCMQIPPVTPDLEKTVGQFLRSVCGREDLELSLNDWGTLYRCSRLKKNGQLKADLTAGVLLAGQDTDPLIASFGSPQPDRSIRTDGNQIALARWRPPAPECLRHWSTPSVFTAVPLLKKLGIGRLELCAQALPFPEEGPGLPVTLIREAIISVFPCKGACGQCGGPARLRGGVSVRAERNLYLADLPRVHPDWIDRVISLGSKTQLTNG